MNEQGKCCEKCKYRPAVSPDGFFDGCKNHSCPCHTPPSSEAGGEKINPHEIDCKNGKHSPGFSRCLYCGKHSTPVPSQGECKHCENCWVTEDGFGSCNDPDCLCHVQPPPHPEATPTDWEEKVYLLANDYAFTVKHFGHQEQTASLSQLIALIRTLIQEAKEEAYKKGNEDGKEGKFFISYDITEDYQIPPRLLNAIKEQAKKEAVEEIIKTVEGKRYTNEQIKDIGQSWFGHPCMGYNKAIDDILQSLTQRKE